MELVGHLDKDCDSDADTIVCLLSDSDTESVPDLKRRNSFSDENGTQRSFHRRGSRCSAASSGEEWSSDVIYVRDSESERESEDDCVIVSCASPGKLSIASSLPPDFFDRETPPLSPRRIAQSETRHHSISYQPELSSNKNGKDNNKNVKFNDKNVNLRHIQVKLPRIDEQLLAECVDSSGNEEHYVSTPSRHSPGSTKTVSESRQNTSVGKHVDKLSSISQMHNISTAQKSPQMEMLSQKRNETCNNTSHAVKSLSPDKSKKIRITLEVPYCKILQLERSIQSIFRTTEYTDHSHNTNEIMNQEIKDNSYSESQPTTEYPKRNREEGTNNLSKRKIQEAKNKNSSSASEHSKKSKKHSREIRYRCEICWLRVPNVADHIVQHHSHLFQ